MASLAWIPGSVGAVIMGQQYWKAYTRVYGEVQHSLQAQGGCFLRETSMKL